MKYLIDSSSIIRVPEVLKYNDENTIILNEIRNELSHYYTNNNEISKYIKKYENNADENIRSYLGKKYKNAGISNVDNLLIGYAKEELNNKNDIAIVTEDKRLIFEASKNNIEALNANEYIKKRDTDNKNSNYKNDSNILVLIRRQKVISNISILIAIFSSIITIFTANNLKTLLYSVQRVLFVLLPITKYVIIVLGTLVIGGLFYLLRSKQRLIYAFIEITFGIIVIVDSITNSNISIINVNNIIKIFGGLYVIIRGYDNMEKGLRELANKKFIFYWEKIFKKENR